MTQYLGQVGGPSGASLITKSISDALDKQRQQKLALAQSLIQSGAYAPTQGQPPSMLGRVAEGFAGPSVGGPNMNIGGQNFQYQSPDVKMANLKNQLQMIQGLGQQPSAPGLGNTNGLPPSLPGVQINPKIDAQSMTATPDITMTSPLQQAEYQDKLLDISKKQQEDKENTDSQQYAGMSPDQVKADIAKRSPTEAAILKKLANGDMPLARK